MVAFVALAYVRKLQEKGMMFYLIGLIMVSQAIYLCISWTVLVSYWDILMNHLNANASYTALMNFQRAQNSFTGVFTFLFILEHTYFATKYWALSKKVDAMIDKTNQDSETMSQIVLWSITSFAAISTSTMVYFMDVLPATLISQKVTFSTQIVTLVCQLAVCIVMLDALRRIYNLKGSKLVVSGKFLALQFTGFLLFLVSGAGFVYLYWNPPKAQIALFASYLAEGIIVNLC